MKTIRYDVNGKDRSSANIKFKVTGVPVVYIIDKEGNVVERLLGYNPDTGDKIAKELDDLEATDR